MTPLLPLLLACAPSPERSESGREEAADPAPRAVELAADREGPVDVGDLLSFTGLFEPSVDLVAVVAHGDWLSPRHEGVVLRDDDADGVADLGPAGSVAALMVAQGEAVAPSSAPLVVTPEADCVVDLSVGAAGAGEAWLLLFEDDGSALQVDPEGRPLGAYAWGGPIDVASDGWPDGTPRHDRALSPGDVATVTFTDLHPDAVYRVSLVSDDVLDDSGAQPIFRDADADGAADLGEAGDIAQITALQGSAIVPVATYPLPSDDPVDPSGVTAIQGRITVEVTAEAAGSVTVALFENRGASTLLEVDPAGAPLEPVGLSGWLIVE